MARPPFSTIPDNPSATIVVVAAGAPLLAACREASRFVGATVEATDVRRAATLIAESRPFAIVLDEDMLSFDPREFEALARDVGAELIAASRGGTEQALIAELLPRLKSAYKRWDARENRFHG